MEGTDFLTILSHILSGGHEAIITILLGVIAYLLYERKLLVQVAKEANNSSLQSKDDEKAVILSIIDRYHSGNLAMVQAVNEIKIVLASIQERIR